MMDEFPAQPDGPKVAFQKSDLESPRVEADRPWQFDLKSLFKFMTAASLLFGLFTVLGPGLSTGMSVFLLVGIFATRFIRQVANLESMRGEGAELEVVITASVLAAAWACGLMVGTLAWHKTQEADLIECLGVTVVATLAGLIGAFPSGTFFAVVAGVVALPVVPLVKWVVRRLTGKRCPKFCTCFSTLVVCYLLSPLAAENIDSSNLLIVTATVNAGPVMIAFLICLLRERAGVRPRWRVVQKSER